MNRLLLLCSCCLLFACRPAPPPTEQRPEPQAAPSEQATELRDTIRAPLDKAKAVEAQTQQAADAQRAAIDAATSQ